MSSNRINYMQDSAWQFNQPKELRPSPPIELPYPPDSILIELTEPDILPETEVNFLELVELRSTGRQYNSQHTLSLKELSYLLWCTQGIKMVLPNKTIRNVPSAGGRNPLETFLYLRRVEGLVPGLYRFLPLEHKLLLIDTSAEVETNICKNFSTQGVVNNCAALFIWSAVYERTACVYGERAYRYIHLDAGHVCENLYYAAQTIKAKTCALGCFDDNALNTSLGLDGTNQFVVYAAGVGK